MNAPLNPLLPCPFCGGEARLDHGIPVTDVSVLCSVCRTNGPMFDVNEVTAKDSTMAIVVATSYAIAAWNTRSQK